MAQSKRYVLFILKIIFRRDRHAIACLRFYKHWSPAEKTGLFFGFMET
jgi:hypothetical protein